MPTTAQQVFVLETPHDTAFAFQAASPAHALELLHTPWLGAALSDFLARHRGASTRCEPMRIRAATPAEATLYRDLADEFADGSGRFLVAELPDETGER